MGKICIIDPKTKNEIKIDHQYENPKKLVKKYTKTQCKKSQKKCQRTVHVLFKDTNNVKVYLCTITKIANPKVLDIAGVEQQIKPTRKITVVYKYSYNLNK